MHRKRIFISVILSVFYLLSSILIPQSIADEGDPWPYGNNDGTPGIYHGKPRGNLSEEQQKKEDERKRKEDEKRKKDIKDGKIKDEKKKDEPKKPEPAWLKALDIIASGVPADSSKGTPPDVRIQIAKNLRKVLKKNMTPEAFYKELAKMEMPDGLEPRHALMQVKRDLVRYRGDQAKNYLGRIFKTGGSDVEMKILKWRRKVVFETINEVIRDFQGQDVVDGAKWTAFVEGRSGLFDSPDAASKNYKVFFSGVGSWMSEAPKNMKFAGDIDFSFLCGNPAVAMAMKQLFDAKILKKVGMSAEHFDTPATAHGMADTEVFVGKHGQSFAEVSIRKGGKVKRIVFGQTIEAAEEVSAEDAFKDMFIDARFAKSGLTDLIEVKWPTEPGVSLEMIRHFEHDITGKDVFSQLESYMKAAKYLKRSFDEVEKTGGVIKDETLRGLCEQLIENKHSSLKTQAEIVRKYYEAIGKPLPVEVELRPTEFGLTPETIKANQAAVKEFYKNVKDMMWDNAFEGFKKRVNDLSTKMRDADMSVPSRVIAIETELDHFREMMEVEIRVLEDPKFGVHEIPKKFKNLMGDFRKMVKGFYKEYDVPFPDMKRNKAMKFIKDQLDAGKPSNLRFAMAMLMETTDNIHSFLDRIDDTLLRDLRGESQSWENYLLEGRKLWWAQKVNLFIGKDIKGTKARFAEHMKRRSSLYQEIEYGMNQQLINNCISQRVRQVNKAFGRSVQGSKTGQVMMKGLVAVNLMREIPVYADVYYKDGWDGLATEFFKRRVPLGSAVENVIMGRYYRAVWDTTVTFIPPLALGDAAFSLGGYFANVTWDTYWSSELELFYDELYENAIFMVGNMEEVDGEIKITEWKLTTVVYNGMKIDVDEFIAKKEKQVYELKLWLQVPHKLRKGKFPVEYAYDGFLAGDSKDGFEQWMKYDRLLRENIYNQDPLLVMIDEMKKNKKVAGKKLLDQYRDMFFARREEVKLNYFKYIKKTLEERALAKLAALGGELPKMTKELEEIAKELRIEKEMDEQMEEEMGGELWAFYAWFRDWFKGIKREVFEQADIWTNYEESVKIVQRYLKTYKKVLESRQKAEEEYYFSIFNDFGQRMLTGKYFLKGKASKDSGKGSKWRNVRPGIEPNVKAELEEIKAKYVDDAGLESDPESFDQKTLGGITDHDMWREVWKYIQSVAKEETPSELSQTDYGRAYEKIKKTIFTVKPKGPTMQDQAIEHNKFHKKERDRLKLEFEEYYMNKTIVDLAEIEKLVLQAEKISIGAMEICNSAVSLCGDAKAKVRRVTTEIKVVEEGLKKLELKVKDFDQMSQAVIDLHKSCEEAGIKVGDLTHDMEKLSLKICQLMQQLKNTKDDYDRGAIFDQINLKKPKLRSILVDAKTKFNDVKYDAIKAQDKFTAITKTIALVKAFTGIEGAYKILGDANRQLTQVSDKIVGLRQKVAQIEKLQKKAKGLADDLERKLAPIKNTTKAKEILKSLGSLRGRLEKAYAEPNACIAKLEKLIEPMDEKLKALEKDLKKFDKQHKEMQKKLEGKDHKLVNTAKEKAEAVDGVVEITKAYITRIEKAAMNGALCVAMAEDIMSTDDDDKPDWAKDKDDDDEDEIKGDYKLISWSAETDPVVYEGYEYRKLKHMAAAILVLEVNGRQVIIQGSRAVQHLIEHKKIIIQDRVGWVLADYKKKIDDEEDEDLDWGEDWREGIEPGDREIIGKKCRGHMELNSTSGYPGDKVYYKIIIEPPESKNVSYVKTDNPSCHNCSATFIKEGLFVWESFYSSTPGPFKLKFIAYDAKGNEMCSGSTGTLTILDPDAGKSKNKTYNGGGSPGHDWDPDEYTDDIVPSG